WVDRHDHIQFAIGVRVVLPAEPGLAVHIHSRDAEILGFLGWHGNAAAAVVWSVDLDIGGPALLDTGLDELGQVLVERRPRSVRRVEPLLEFSACGARPDRLQKRNTA